MRIVLALCVLCTLSACSLTTPRDVGNANMFTLSAPDDIAGTHKKYGVLKVNYPSVPSELDTYRIAVTREDGRQDYFAGARWSEFLPSIVQSALQDSLAQSQVFSYVETDDDNVANEYILRTEIEECRAVYEAKGRPPVIAMRMVFSFSPADASQHAVRFTIEESTQADNNSLLSIAKAFNSDFDGIARKVVQKLSQLDSKNTHHS